MLLSFIKLVILKLGIDFFLELDLVIVRLRMLLIVIQFVIVKYVMKLLLNVEQILKFKLQLILKIDVFDIKIM